MARQERGSGGGIFGIGAPTRIREAPPPVLPETEVAPPPTPEPTKKSLHERLAGVLKSRLVRLGLATGVIGLGGGAGVYKAYQEIPAVHRSVGDIIGRVSVENVQNNSNVTENAASVKRLDKIPPGRENIQENTPPANTEGKLPEIKPYIQEYKLGGVGETHFASFPSVFTFRLKEEPPSTQTIKVFNLEHPEGTMIETTTPRPPNIYTQGYVLAKERDFDGSVWIAVGIPKDENQLFSNKDLDKPGSTRINARGSEGGISDVIVWLRIPNFADYQPPLQPSSLGWSLPDTNGVRPVMNETTDPNEVFEYIRTGDPVYAGGYKPPYPNDKGLDALQQNYQRKKGKIPYETAKEQYLTLGNQNVEILQKMVEDAKAGNVSLREQLETKRYVINVDYLKFVVGD